MNKNAAGAKSRRIIERDIMRGLTLEKIAAVTGGTFYLSILEEDGSFTTMTADGGMNAGDAVKNGLPKLLCTEVSSIVTDSRKAGEGTLFGAIVGARVDGHDFISGVFEKGALCVLSERELAREDLWKDKTGGGSSLRPWILVEDTQTALGRIAEEYLKILNIPVVGITGSVGKTSTKEMIASVLSVKFRTLKTEGNFNNELGLPLTVFRIDDQTQIAVLEMGVSHFGDMEKLAAITRPDVMVITNIGTCHLEYLVDRDGVFRAKTEVFDYMKSGSRVILNGNDDKLRGVKEVQGSTPCFFGVDSSLEGVGDLSAGPAVDYPGDLAAGQCVSVSDIRLLGFEGSLCTIQTPAGELKVKVPVPGIHNCSNAAAACAVGLGFGMTLEEIGRGIESAQTISGRFRILKSKDRTVIDDCYNANPVSMKSSLAVLAGGEGRRVAILGDMGELGPGEEKLHEDVGRFAARSADHLITIGKLSRSMYEAARESDPELSCVWYEDVEAFLKEKETQILPGDSVLVKASHYMQFGQIVDALTEC